MKNYGAAALAGILAGCTFVAGFTVASNGYEEELHKEHFEAVVIDGEGFYAEAVNEDGTSRGGEGVFLDVDMIPIEVNEGDIVEITWTENQAKHSDWDTPMSVKKEETK